MDPHSLTLQGQPQAEGGREDRQPWCSPSQEQPALASMQNFGLYLTRDKDMLISVSMGSGDALGGNKEMQRSFFPEPLKKL